MSSSYSFPIRWIIGPLLLLASSAHAQDVNSEYGASPLAPEAVAAARAGVIREDTPGEAGRLHHRFTFADGAVVEFEDRPKAARDTAKRERVVSHVGQHSATKEPEETFAAAGASAGLSPEAITALRYVSRHEGGFDAINTWDSARFSWGFIQFAGGYGLRPMLAYLKSKSPETFRNLLAVYGIDVLPDATGKPEPVLVAPAGEALRGAAAEQAFGDDPLLIAAFIRAGGVPEVKQRQVETAIRNYAAPALRAQHQGQLLAAVLSSPQGLAMLMDRQVHEGNVERLRWALEHARIQQGVSEPQRWAELEGRVLDLAVRDADARTIIVDQSQRASAALQRAAEILDGSSQPSDEEMPIGQAEALIAEAKEALTLAIWQSDYRMVVGPRRDAVRVALSTPLDAIQEAHLAMLSKADLCSLLRMNSTGCRLAGAPFRYERLVYTRLLGIRRSNLVGPPAAEDMD